jgi:hypothetical protein
MTRRSAEELVTVASAQNQAEAEFVQNILRDAGVPSILRRSAGADVPDFLAAGRRDVLVPASGLLTAREVLLQAEMISETPASPTAPGRVLAGLLAAVLLVGVIVWVGAELLG